LKLRDCRLAIVKDANTSMWLVHEFSPKASQRFYHFDTRNHGFNFCFITFGGTEARVAPKIALGGKAVRVTRVGSDGGRGAAGKTSATPPPLGSVRAMPRAKRDASMASAFLQAVKNVAWAGGCVVVEGATET